MAKAKRRYRKRMEAYPRFDATESMSAGVALLKEADVPFALIGRLAVWVYVPPEAQAYTKDVDFAVPYGHTDVLARLAGEKGYEVTNLSIGGCGIKAPQVVVDFVHRHPALSDLFAAAVAEAGEQDSAVEMGELLVPVVPIEYLIVMKIATHESKDEQDAMELLRVLPDDAYVEVDAAAQRYLGFLGRQRLRTLARSVGHPGANRARYQDEGD